MFARRDWCMSMVASARNCPKRQNMFVMYVMLSKSRRSFESAWLVCQTDLQTNWLLLCRAAKTSF